MGIVIGADDITLDLNGHTIDGIPGPYISRVGVENRGYDGVTIQNGTIREFTDGVVVFEGDGNRVRRLVVSDNDSSGIFVVSAIVRNSLSENQFAGISSYFSERVLIARNSVSRTDAPLQPGVGVGIQVVDSTDNRVERNRVVRSGTDGIRVDSPSTTLARNTANANGDLGIQAVPGVNDGGRNRASANGNPLSARSSTAADRPPPSLLVLVLSGGRSSFRSCR